MSEDINFVGRLIEERDRLKKLAQRLMEERDEARQDALKAWDERNELGKRLTVIRGSAI